MPEWEPIVAALTPAQRERIEKIAERRGIDFDEAVKQLIAERLQLELEPEPEKPNGTAPRCQSPTAGAAQSSNPTPSRASTRPSARW